MTRYGTLGFSPAIDCTLTLDREPACGSVSRCVDETEAVGGKSLNVARLLACTGCDVTAAGLIGCDAADLYHRQCEIYGIRPAFRMVDHPTRRNLTLLSTAGESKINRPAFPDLQPDIALFDQVIAPLLGLEVVVLSGSLPPRFTLDAVEHVIRRLKQSGCCVAVDAPASVLRTAVNAGADILSPNRAEFCELIASEKIEPAQLVNWLAATGCELLLLSDGPRGAWFVAPAACLHAASPDVAVCDTTGAGDALLAQCLVDYFPERCITRAVASRAVAAGAAACERKGPVSPDPQRIAALLSSAPPCVP